ncbi:DEAD/DEAH box helicase [Candidatus Peregrinibacteria bacterium]|nr:DEAD/DEAH box helicase [Candidatus Peregrinibacteria bacterium]
MFRSDNRNSGSGGGNDRPKRKFGGPKPGRFTKPGSSAGGPSRFGGFKKSRFVDKGSLLEKGSDTLAQRKERPYRSADVSPERREMPSDYRPRTERPARDGYAPRGDRRDSGGRGGFQGRSFTHDKRNRGGKTQRLRGTNISVDQLVSKVSDDAKVEHVELVIKHKFEDFALDRRLLDNIAKKGYLIPSPIQDQAIKPLLEGRDVIGLANTGTGKTAAFLLPIINKILFDRTQKAIILAPTRELAVQIADELKAFTVGMNIYSVICIGGTNIREQQRRIRMPFNILIGTPGRVIDLYERRMLNLDRFQTAVLDEADRMVDMGFIGDMQLVFSKLPKQRQNMFFTATFDKKIEGLVQQFMNSPVTISVKKRETTANVEQDIIHVRDQAEKFMVLQELLRKPGFEKVLVFGRTKHGVEKISKKLRDAGFRADSIHGNKSQNYRLRALKSFKTGEVDILIATDIAARGLDIPNVSHVINFDLPANYEDYVHRIGRTGRASQKGFAISLV